MPIKKAISQNSLAVQWLGLHAFTVKGLSSIPGWGTKIPQAVQCENKTKQNKKAISAAHSSNNLTHSFPPDLILLHTTEVYYVYFQFCHTEY